MVDANPANVLIDRWEDIASYVRTHFERDIEINRRLLGIDISPDLGVLLARYLSMADASKDTFMEYGVKSMFELQSALSVRTGKEALFLEMYKCGFPIHQMFTHGDHQGLDRVLAYSNELIKRGWKPSSTDPTVRPVE